MVAKQEKFSSWPWRKPQDVPVDAWQAIQNILMASVRETTRARRWRIFFRCAYLLIFIWLVVLLTMNTGPFKDRISFQDLSGAEHVALIRMTGLVMDKSINPTGINADSMNESLRKAFDNSAAKAVILSINSPGGSPVQSGQIFDELLRLRATQPEKKVYAVIKELGASAAYYIAAGSDEIYCDKSSLVGAIGIISGGFGFDEAMKKWGIERRLYTAGEHKGFLDPFLPVQENEKIFWEETLAHLHEHFIKDVQRGRGVRLDSYSDVFSGYIFDGERAVELGLADGLGTVRSVAKDRVGIEKLVDYTPQLNPVDLWLDNFSQRFAQAVMNALSRNFINIH